jgi:hypothetical protein
MIASAVERRAGRTLYPGNLSVCAERGLAVFAFSAPRGGAAAMARRELFARSRPPGRPPPRRIASSARPGRDRGAVAGRGPVRYARAVSVFAHDEATLAPFTPRAGAAAAVRAGALLATLATLLIAIGFTYLAVRGSSLAHRLGRGRALPRLVARPGDGRLRGADADAGDALAIAVRPRAPAAPRAVVEATLIGYLFNNIMPARAGEVARVAALTKRSSTPPAEIVGTVVVERVYDVFAVLLIFFCASPWLPHVSWIGAAAILAAVAAVGLAAVVAVLAIYGERPLHWLARPLARLPASRPKDRAPRRPARQRAVGPARAPRRARGARLEPRRLDDTALWAWFVLLAFHHLPFSAGVLVTVASACR